MLNATGDLSFHLCWIDGKTDILHGNVVKYTHLTRSGINCYLRDMRGKHWRRLSDCSTPTSIDRFIFACKPHRLRGDAGYFNILTWRPAHNALIPLSISA